MTLLGQFTGIGVGPGAPGMISVIALQALKQADLIYLPRARSSELSVARLCLRDLELPEERLREIEFQMDPDRQVLVSHYAHLAEQIAAHLRIGKNVAYLTLGDSMTYSTYGYLLSALRDIEPGLTAHTLPGITSFAAAAAALSWPLGEGKERILILPCPDDMQLLRNDIESHDVVILMKIGNRLDAVLKLLQQMQIAGHCAFAGRIGLPGERLCDDLQTLDADTASGYLATLLIRRHPREKRT